MKTDSGKWRIRVAKPANGSWKKCVLILLFSVFHFQFSAISVRAYEPQFADDAKKVRLRWKSGVINIALSNSLRQPPPNFKANSDIVGAVKRSLATWEAVANVRFVTTWTDKSSISAIDGKGDGASLITIAATPENTAPFQGDAAEMPGRTRFFFTARGLLTEADIVLNPYQQFSTDGSFGTFDAEAALTHEIGHLLGLDHSAVWAATMFVRQGKNGTFSLPAFAPRSLAADDRAGVRSLYGAKTPDETCCGAIAGNLQATANGKPLENWQVWAEEIESGRLAAAVSTGAGGAFSLAGLSAGKYRVGAQPAGENLSAEILGETSVEESKTTSFNRKIQLRERNFEPLLVGYNGQLSTIGVPVQSGHWQTIFFGGENLSLQNFAGGEISFASPFLQIAPDSLTNQDFDAAFPVLSFNLRVNRAATPGEYSLRLQNRNGETAYLLGGFSVEQE